MPATCFSLRAACESSRLGEGSLSRLGSGRDRGVFPSAHVFFARRERHPDPGPATLLPDEPLHRVNYGDPARRNGDAR